MLYIFYFWISFSSSLKTSTGYRRQLLRDIESTICASIGSFRLWISSLTLVPNLNGQHFVSKLLLAFSLNKLLVLHYQLISVQAAYRLVSNQNSDSLSYDIAAMFTLWPVNISMASFCFVCSIIHKTRFNKLKPRQNSRHFPDAILRYIFVNEKFCILIKILLNFFPEGPIGNNPTLV